MQASCLGEFGVATGGEFEVAIRAFKPLPLRRKW